MPFPDPTQILRFMHVDNLRACLEREALYAPLHNPKDGHVYRPIHDEEVQSKRTTKSVPCGPRGVIHDYVPFYFGPLSPMLLRLKTNRVRGYTEGQEPLIYVASTAQAVQRSGTAFVFSDGHGIASFTSWYADLAKLDQIDWGMVGERYWSDNINDMDRQRRKQAEFLIYRKCPWTLIEEIGVLTQAMKDRVEGLLAGCAPALRKPVRTRPEWYY